MKLCVVTKNVEVKGIYKIKLSFDGKRKNAKEIHYASRKEAYTFFRCIYVVDYVWKGLSTLLHTEMESNFRLECVGWGNVSTFGLLEQLVEVDVAFICVRAQRMICKGKRI